MTNVQTAQGYIRSHGFEAYITPDGLLALMPTKLPEPEVPNAFYTPVSAYHSAEVHHYADCFMDEPEVFPVTNGMVDMGPIRAWLGY